MYLGIWKAAGECSGIGLAIKLSEAEMGAEDYGLGQKIYISRFFSLICGKIVVIIYFMLIIALKDLVFKWYYKKLATEKSVIYF